MDGSMSLNAIVSQQSQTISARLDLVTSAINSAEQVESEMEFICFNYLSLEGLTRLVDAFASVNIPGAHERFQMHSLGERFYINISREDATSLIDLFNQTNYPIFTSLSQRVVATLFILPAEPRASSADGGSCGAKGPRMKLLRTDPDEIDPPLSTLFGELELDDGCFSSRSSGSIVSDDVPFGQGHERFGSEK